LSLRGELCRSNLMVGPKGEIAAIRDCFTAGKTTGGSQ
jgi:hypothetical protein